jgi:putative hydrolase of the HAD superfamily
MLFLFDAANTLIHKPLIYPTFVHVLKRFDYTVAETDIKRMHKLISEIYTFPDRTDKLFYHRFNADILMSLGVLPSPEMLEELYKECSYLPWEKFADAGEVKELKSPKAVLSNFHGGLDKIIADLFPNVFDTVIISENQQYRKPDSQFFQYAISALNVTAADIIYTGDSIKLDVIPGLSEGINSWLIDRDNNYPNFKNRLSSLKELTKFDQ